jgi:hypothetical protein
MRASSKAARSVRRPSTPAIRQQNQTEYLTGRLCSSVWGQLGPLRSFLGVEYGLLKPPSRLPCAHSTAPCPACPYRPPTSAYAPFPHTSHHRAHGDA